jgi:hypothetical protein
MSEGGRLVRVAVSSRKATRRRRRFNAVDRHAMSVCRFRLTASSCVIPRTSRGAASSRHAATQTSFARPARFLVSRRSSTSRRNTPFGPRSPPEGHTSPDRRCWVRAMRPAGARRPGRCAVCLHWAAHQPLLWCKEAHRGRCPGALTAPPAHLHWRCAPTALALGASERSSSGCPGPRSAPETQCGGAPARC